jgi:drug/metabolite transporter (DMT)-like permease
VTSRSGTRARAFLVLALAIGLNAAGNLLLSEGMRGTEGVAKASGLSGLLDLVGGAFDNPLVLIGLGLLVGFFVLFLSLLSWADVSYVLPMVSSCFAVNSLLAFWLLGETVSPLRWVGIAVVTLGVGLVGATAPDGGRRLARAGEEGSTVKENAEPPDARLPEEAQ